MSTPKSNKRIFFIILFFLFIFLFFYFINIFDFFYSQKDQNNFLPAENTERISEKIEIKDSNEFYGIYASYPRDSWDQSFIMKNFIEKIVQDKKTEWALGGEIYMEEKKLSEMFPDRPIPKYELYIDYYTYKSDIKSTVSYLFKIYEFTGGAHGNTYVSTFSFDKMGLVSFDKVFDLSLGKDKVLSEMMEKKLFSILGEYSDEEMIKNGLGLSYINEDGEIDYEKCACPEFTLSKNFENFLLKENEVVFVLGQYQVAPYVAGLPEVPFSYEELSVFLR